MTAIPVLHTTRLLLRSWRPEDLEPFATMNDDPDVMRYLPNRLTREQTQAMIARIQGQLEADGFGFWAVERVADGRLIGLTGIANVLFEAPFTPAVEVGWRYASDVWGQGYATEAATAALDYGFDVLGLPQIVAFTVPANMRSQNVMRRLGMTHDAADDFDHPRLADDHPLRRHVLYRMPADRWFADHF